MRRPAPGPGRVPPIPALAQQALREALPRQASLPPLLANLVLVAREPARFAPQLVDAARSVLGRIPDARALADADVLAERVQRSGLWLEATLAGIGERSSSSSLASDWKAALLRLASSLRLMAAPAQAQAASPSATVAAAPDAAPLLRAGAPQPQARAEATLAQLAFAADDPAAAAQHLLKQVEGALARVELGQLASLPGEDTQAQRWWLELPVRAPDGGADVLQMRIEREAAGAGAAEEEAVWAVSLAFDLGSLGPVRARIAVRGESVFDALLRRARGDGRHGCARGSAAWRRRWRSAGCRSAASAAAPAGPAPDRRAARPAASTWSRWKRERGAGTRGRRRAALRRRGCAARHGEGRRPHRGADRARGPRSRRARCTPTPTSRACSRASSWAPRSRARSTSRSRKSSPSPTAYLTVPDT